MRSFRAVKALTSILCSTSPRNFSTDSLLVSAEVSEALSSNRPVVGLESAVLTHGMPHPQNLSTALEMEALIRQQGAIPATTAVLDGILRVGVSPSELERLCTATHKLVKVSRRDLAPCVSTGLTGGTTVSGGMLLSHWAGIKLFVTGGLGGVHEGGERSMDISTDLTEMGRSPLAVVCAGVKSILDLERTLEVLETQGVTVCTLGGDEIPGFFSQRSGVKTPLRVNSIEDATKLILANRQLKLCSGVLVCVPIPEAESVAREEIDQLMHSGMSLARDSGVRGKYVTPFLLEHVRDKTNGRSLQANISLLKNNALVGGQIATCLSQISKRSVHTCSSSHGSSKGVHTCAGEEEDGEQGRPVVVGAINFDIMLRVNEREVMPARTNAGWIRHSLGGVGRNLAQCISQVGDGCEFISAVGTDAFGQMVLSELPEAEHVRRIQIASTAKYCVLLDQSGELMYGVADMDIHKLITPQLIDQFSHLISKSPLVVFDANLTHETISHLLHQCAVKGVPTWFEPTCPNSSSKFLTPYAPLFPSFISPNTLELLAIHKAVFKREISSPPLDFTTAELLCTELLTHIPVILLTMGAQGVLLAVRHEQMLHSTQLLLQLSQDITGNPVPYSEHFRFYHFPAVQVSEVVSVSGAGDCLAGTVVSGLAEGRSLQGAISSGMRAASLSLQSADTVPDTLTPQVFVQVEPTVSRQHS